MPIVVRKIVEDQYETHLVIADNMWDLREQVEALEAWLGANANSLDEQCQWVADIGFTPREDARGGGPPITCKLMQMCLEANLDIYLSQYPRLVDPSEAADALLALLQEAVQPGSSGMASAERYLLAEAEYDLECFQDDPNSTFYMIALLQKELLQSITDPVSKRLFMLRCLHDSLETEEATRKLKSTEVGNKVAHVKSLIDVLLNQAP